MTKKKILAISGSTKKSSSNLLILKTIAELYSDLLVVEIYDSIDQLPHFNPDLDNENPPKIVTDFRNRIHKSDGVIICTPEYVFSIPGSLKNAIEWNVSTTHFSNKPVAIIVAAASGEKAFESLDLIMTTIESRLPEPSKLLIKGIKGKVKENGDLDTDTKNKVNALVQSLIKSIDEQEAIPTKYESL